MYLNYLVTYIPTAGQTVKFDYVSMIFVAIIAIFLIVGIFKGFFATLLGFCRSIGSIIISVLLCKQIGNFIYSSSLGNKITSLIYDWVSTQGDGILNQPVTYETKETLLLDAYETLGIPKVLHGVLNGILTPLIPDTGEVVLSEVMAKSLANFSCIIIGFILCWIVFFIVFKLLSLLFKKVNKLPIIGPLNRIFGGVLGLATGFAFCFVICYAISFLFSTGVDVGNIVMDWMGIGNDSVWTFSKTLYEINFVQRILDLFV